MISGAVICLLTDLLACFDDGECRTFFIDILRTGHDTFTSLPMSDNNVNCFMVGHRLRLSHIETCFKNAFSNCRLFEYSVDFFWLLGLFGDCKLIQ